MGYRPKREPFKLDFTGSEYDGLEVAVRPLATSVMFDILNAAGRADTAALRQIYATFAFALDSWNVEDEEGQPVPADLDGLLSQDPGLVMAVVTAWAAKMTGGA